MVQCFEESLLLNSCNLEQKHSREDKRQIKKQHFREAMEKIENDYECTLVDRVYGGRNSLRKHDKGRMKQFFETVPAATKRTIEENDKIEKGLKKPKNHVGNFPITKSIQLVWKIKRYLGLMTRM